MAGQRQNLPLLETGALDIPPFLAIRNFMSLYSTQFSRIATTSKRDPNRPRPASPIAPPGAHAGSAANIREARDHLERALALFRDPAATTIWPFASERTLASPPWPFWRLRRGLWATSIARCRSSTACRRASHTSPTSARSQREERSGHIRIDAGRSFARRPTPSNSPDLRASMI